ncbi:MAG: sigma-54 dependent transcriptional regulator [Myxococcota bacterium]
MDESEKPLRLLVVDDEANARAALVELLGDEGYEVRDAEDGAAALEVIERGWPEVVLTDLKMPRVGGVELVRRGKAVAPELSFVVMTAFGSVDTAVEAIQAGADNYLTKPLDMDAVSALVARAGATARLAFEAAELRRRVDRRLQIGGLIGDHPSMQRVLKLVEQVARSRATVLIEGESGTGKELIAAAVHHNSPRSKGPFVKLNCAALAEGVLESELFGHEKGAFTGAQKSRPGRFEQADGGTLFLDEVGEIPAAMQVKLLRFLQEREFERVGSNETRSVDVRVVAATNRKLADQVRDGEFREDLYYRLNVVRIEMPPLRARRSDVPLLATHFLRKFADENQSPARAFSTKAMDALIAHSWAGNVRELENTVERAVVLCTDETIGADMLFGESLSATSSGGLGLLIPGVTMAEVERLVIEKTLEAVGGSTAEAARILGISRRKVQYRLREWSGDEGGDANDG